MKDRIKQHYQALQAWFMRLSAKDQRALKVVSVVSLLAIFYAGIWSPLAMHRERMRQAILDQEKVLSFMQETDQAISQLEAKKTSQKKVTSPVMLLQVLEEQLQRAGLQASIVALKQSATNTVALQLQAVDVNQVLQILSSLVQEQPVTLTDLTMVAGQSPGVGDISVLLMLLTNTK